MVIRFSALALLIAVVAISCSSTSADERPGAHHRYASAEEQRQWQDELAQESAVATRVGFDPLGEVRSVAGVFTIRRGGAAPWLLAHRKMLGLPQNAKVEVVGREPFFRFDGDTDRRVGDRYVYRVEYKGFPFVGKELSVIVDLKGTLVLGAYSGFSPPLGGFGKIAVSPEDRAWRAAATYIGSPLTHVSAVETWFDLSWALSRVSSTNELHWRLEGVDMYGNVRHVFVKSATNQVVFATPARTDFSVQQTHRDDASNVLWDSQTGGCVSGSAGCSGRSLEDSLLSRDVLPRVVDIWYGLSSGGPPPFVWPFSVRIDNSGRAINAIVTHNQSQCSLPCRINSTYYFPLDTDTVEVDPSSSNPPQLRAPTTVTPEVFGHEYGHTILERLKVMHPGGIDEGKKQPATFTEAMADFIGLVTEDVFVNQKYGCCGTDFQILGTRWSKDGQKFLDYARVSWPLRTGDCAGRGRARLGHAFWNAWKEDAYFYGDRPSSVRNATFRAWWIDIMRSFALVGDFPTITDFYNATQSRLGGYTLIEAGVSFRLAVEMEKLGLDQGGCL